jgi:hypothetical protein
MTPQQKLGIAFHEIIDPFLVWFLSQSPLPSDEETTAWLQGQVDDWKDVNGVTTSIKQDAVFLVENGKDQLAPILGAMLTADAYGMEDIWAFAKDWKPLGRVTLQEYFKKATWGGPADVWWVKDNVLHVRDWKSGKVYPDWDQIKGYGLYGILVMPEIEKVEGGFVFVKAGQTVTDTWTREELLEYREELVAKTEAIENAEEYPATPGRFQCSGCPLLDCEDRMT